MSDEAEKKVSDFYSNFGWDSEDDVTEDAKLFEDLRPCARKYVSDCRLRVLRHIPKSGENILDMASGPIQYREYLEFSKGYKKRHCVDLSAQALKDAERKIGDHGAFHHGSFFDLPFEENYFDCAISLHTIYHMDKDRQEAAVRKLIRLVKPGKPIVVVYSNPRTLTRLILTPLFAYGRIRSWFRKRPAAGESQRGLYFYSHPLGWWSRFGDEAQVELLPWRSFASNHQKMFFPGDRFAGRALGALFVLEEKLPWLFTRLFQYPMIVLTKKP